MYENSVEEKQWKICELHEYLGIDYTDIEQIDSNTYVNTLDGKKYNVVNVKKKHIFKITPLEDDTND